MTKREFRAPRDDRSVLMVPDLAQMASALRKNRDSLESAQVKIDGESLRSFRQRARREVLEKSLAYLRAAGEPIPEIESESLLVSGHQPELFHLGVWVKNFVLNRVANDNGLTPLNLVVDNDTMKASSLRFPSIPANRDPAGVHYQSIPFDLFSGEMAFEDRPILDDAAFSSFCSRAGQLTRDWGFEPLCCEVWNQVLDQAKTTRNIGECFARVRRTWERKWGCRNLEVPLSWVCETDSFRRFRDHLLNDLPNFHAIYNRGVHRYREENGVRSKNHPVPDLVAEGDWLEAPFWVLDPSSQKRGRLMVRRTTSGLEYRSGGEMLRAPLRLRTRALTTTLFSRLCLGDGFLHGIGGAKYDEVTDAIMEEWLGIEPPSYFVVTATLRLPLRGFPTTSDDLKATELRRRDLFWNPQRHLAGDSELIAEKERLIASEPEGRDERKEWYRKLSWLTESIRPAVEAEMNVVRDIEERQRVEVEANAVLQRRDYSWVLFPESMLREFFATVM